MLEPLGPSVGHTLGKAAGGHGVSPLLPDQSKSNSAEKAWLLRRLRAKSALRVALAPSPLPLSPLRWAVATYGHPPYNEQAAAWESMSPVETTLHAAIEAIDEPRSARMDQRTKPSVKASIEAAADLMGIEASAFVVMSAYARAQELLSGRQQTLLSQGDHQALLAALDEETTPTPALLEAWQLHHDQVVRS